ncbi:MAG TPA: N-acetylmuramoyl-L-alanine amidase [Bdellovibrionales bacterium]|nr:N-acetylmuramoyl-L-alanine amidase [Bdellovibrionales bacterium]
MKTALVFAALFLGAPIHALARPLHVIVDPGHGGTDAGAVHDGLKESDIVLKVSKHLASLLQKDSRFKVTLTRQKNSTMSLSERTNLAREVRGDVFLSIHVNSAIEGNPKGAELYFQNQMPPDEESRWLASRENAGAESLDTSKTKGDVPNIIDDLKRSYHTHLSFSLVRHIRNTWSKTGAVPAIRQGPFHVLYEVAMPSALVELGFLTHPQESKWLASPETQRTLAQILYEGLVQFKEKLDKQRPKS